MALGKVCYKARCSFEKGQHPLDDPKVELGGEKKATTSST
jgi:hypothetical protein